MNIWQELEAFEPDGLGDSRADYNHFIVYYNDQTIRIMPAVDTRIPPAVFEHYGITSDMKHAGIVTLFRRDTKERIAHLAAQKVAMYRRYDAEHEVWKADHIAAGTWHG